MTSPPTEPTGSTVSLLRPLSVASHLPLPVSKNCRSCLSLLQLLPVNTACHPMLPARNARHFFCYYGLSLLSVTTACTTIFFSFYWLTYFLMLQYYLYFYFYVSSSILDLMFRFLFSFLLFFDSFPTFFIYFFKTWNTPSLFVIDNYVKHFSLGKHLLCHPWVSTWVKECTYSE